MLLAACHVHEGEQTSLPLIYYMTDDKPALQGCRPCRISEAEPYLRKILTSPTVLQDTTHFHEVHASLYLAMALSNSPVHSTQLRDSEALLLYSRYFAIYEAQLCDSASSLIIPPSLSRIPNALGLSVTTPIRPCHRTLPAKTELWARASFASLLQRLGLDGEAVKQVEHIRYVFDHLAHSL